MKNCKLKIKSQESKVKSHESKVKSEKLKIKIKLVFILILENWRSFDQGLPGYRFNIGKVKIGR